MGIKFRLNLTRTKHYQSDFECNQVVGMVRWRCQLAIHCQAIGDAGVVGMSLIGGVIAVDC